MTVRHPYRKALLGLELTDAEREHTTSCAECRTAIATAERLDDRLRTAARPLAAEPLPDGVLDDALAGLGAGRRWVPSLAAVGLGVAVVALSVGGPRLGDIGRSTPSPAVRPQASTSLSVSPSAEPSVLPEVTMYAEAYGLSLDEAIRRTQIMSKLDNTLSPLRRAVGERWAGGWMEHEPEFRFVVRLTGEGWEEFVAATAGLPLQVRFIDGAEHSESDLLAAMDRIAPRINEEAPWLGYGLDVRTGAIVLSGPEEPSVEFLAEVEELAGVPVRYEYSPPVTTQ